MDADYPFRWVIIACRLTDGAIDNLFGDLFETIEILCSQKIYAKPENAESDVMRILNFMLLREDFYRIYLNDQLPKGASKDLKVDIWFESGENRIYEAISQVFRESLTINRNQIKDLIPYLTERLQGILNLYQQVANVGVPAELASMYKDPYSGKTWYPFKQLFGVLGLSVFSKALLVEVHRNTPGGVQSLLAPGQSVARAKSDEFNPLEQVERIKRVNVKLATLLEESSTFPDIELLRAHPEVFAFLKDRYLMCLVKMDEFSKFSSMPFTLFNVIEENELSIWAAGKRPVSRFLWDSNKVERMLEHVCWFSQGYKKDYLVRDLSYENYKYVLFEYERLHYGYTDAELAQTFDLDIDDEDGIQVQREHVFAQSAVNYQDLKNVWLTITDKNYDDWIWKIGNIALLEHTINIGNAGNKTVWEKADYYEKSAFKGTQALAVEIKRLKELVDAATVSASESDRLAASLLPFKLLFEIRDLELLVFTYYRFS